ncbi:MAG: hypothetical protein WDO17_17500 [Alphaproteobacteria bacterium]
MATWVGATSNYNSSSNWTGDTPDAPGETATFGATGSTTVTVNANVSPDSWIFSSSAQSYTTVGVPTVLNSGLVNNSAVPQLIGSAIAGSAACSKTAAARSL